MLTGVRENLHLILNFDSIATNFDELFLIYPSLYRNMEIIWLQPPSTDTISSLPKQIITTLSEEKDTIPVPSYFMKAIEMQIKEEIPPQKFYWLIKSYCSLYSTFEQTILKQLQKLKVCMYVCMHMCI